MILKILVGSYTSQITTLLFDSEAKTLNVASTVASGQSPSWIAQHPSDKSLIFATNEVTDGKVQLFKLADDGHLEFIEECSSGGADPASLAVSDSAVIVANYSGGSLLPIPLSPTAPHLLPPTQEIISFEGSGPNEERQTSSHPHQVIFHPRRPELLIPDLGVDKVWRLTQNEEGVWSIVGDVSFEPGYGPRHAVIHSGVLYTAQELANVITSHVLPPLPDQPFPLSTLPSLSPPSKARPDMLLGEIILSRSTPPHPSPLIYVTNRNEPVPPGDTIAVYTPHHPSSLPASPISAPTGLATSFTSTTATPRPTLPTTNSGGEFQYIGSIPTGLNHLRAIALGGPDLRYLVAGGVQGGGIKVFERVGASLREIASTQEVEKPTSFLWV